MTTCTHNELRPLSDTTTQVEIMSFIRKAVDQHPMVAINLAFLGSYYIPRIIDPSGTEIKRSFLKRFFTITLPDNLPLALFVLSKYIPDFAIVIHPSTFVVTVMIAGTLCQGLEFSRIVMAWSSGKINHPWAQFFSDFIAPRDYYAIQK